MKKPLQTVSPIRGGQPIVDRNGGPSLAFVRAFNQHFPNVQVTYALAAGAAATAAAAVPQTRKINTTSPILGGGTLANDLTLSHAASGVTATSYTNANITVDAKGHVTAASSGAASSSQGQIGFILDGHDGEDGLPGPPGSAGPAGATGATGAAGAAGPQGSPGFGLDGRDGEDGISIPGTPGVAGAAGAPGVAGPQGPIGFAIDGLDGDEGMPIPGAAGAAGATGAVGPQGPIGFAMDGEEGPEGFAIPGAPGPAGATGGGGLIVGSFDTLNTAFASLGNTTTTETDVFTYTIPASQLATNGDRVELEASGTFVSSGTATRQIRAYFGGTLIFDTGALTVSLSAAWDVFCTVTRVSSTVVRYAVSMTTEGAALAAYTASGEVTGLTLSNTNIIKVTGTAAGVGAATNDIVCKMGAVEFKPSTPDVISSSVQGDILYRDTSVWKRLAAGTSGQLLQTLGASANPVWANRAVPQPQGRLTLVSATPVMTSDQTAKTTVYYAEYAGNLLPIYDGANTTVYAFSNLSAILDTTNHKIENLYDVYGYLSSGAAAIGFGPAWVNTATVTWTSAAPGVCSWTAHGLYEGAPVIFTAGTATPTGITAGTTYYVSKTGLTANAFSVSTTVANAAAGTNVTTSSTGTGTQTGTNHTTIRGTGSGTTELELKNGLWVNKNAITLYNNSVASSSVSADQATYLGTIYCTANGQTGLAMKPAAAGGGNNTIMGLYNAYNRIPITGISRDNTASWTYAVSTWRAANGNTNNRVMFVDGLQQSLVNVFLMFHSNGSSTTSASGVNLDSTANSPGAVGQINTSSTATLVGPQVNEIFPPQLGAHFIQYMEWRGVGTCNFYGAQASGQLNNLNVTLEM